MTPAPDRLTACSTRLCRGSRALLHRCAANARRTFATSPHEVILYGLCILLLIVLVGCDVKSPMGALAVLGMLWALGREDARPRARASRVEPPEAERRALAGSSNARDHKEAPWKSER